MLMYRAFVSVKPRLVRQLCLAYAWPRAAVSVRAEVPLEPRDETGYHGGHQKDYNAGSFSFVARLL